MNSQFSLIPHEVAEKLAVTEIIQCNSLTSRFDLVLKESEAMELAKTRADALEAIGRIEFAGGSINKLITEFCDSPYLNQSNYADTLNQLVEAFYYFKNETLDEMDDDELISMMKDSFDKTCRGSIDLLLSRDLENLSRRIRFGIDDFDDLTSDLSGIFEEDLEPDTGPDGLDSLDDLYDKWYDGWYGEWYDEEDLGLW